MLWIGAIVPFLLPVDAQDVAAMRQQVEQNRTEILLLRAEIASLRKEIAGVKDALPLEYVPRREHDARDHNLDVANRLSKVEDALDRVKDQLQIARSEANKEENRDLKEFGKIIAGCSLTAGMGFLAIRLGERRASAKHPNQLPT
jgi:hypothetical protein